MTENSDSIENLNKYLVAIFERKVENIVVLDVRGLTSYTDTLVIITATSSRQVSSIAEHVYIAMKKIGDQAIGKEGIKEGSWALLDYGDVLIHVFNEETGAFYDIEGLWSDAPKIDISEFTEADNQELNNKTDTDEE